MKVLVLGAGVVGTATALELARRGIEVTLIDRGAEPATGTSHANGGGITPAHAEPWNAPGIFSMLLRWIGRHDAPFRLRPKAVPGMTGWGIRFLLNSRPRRFLENARASTRLAAYSAERLKAWRESLGLDYAQRTLGSMKIFRETADLEHTENLLRSIGHPDIGWERLDPAGAVAREPALDPVRAELAGALYFPGNETGDARLFSIAAAQKAREFGARLEFSTTVRAIDCAGQGFRRVRTDRGDFEACACVVCLGCDSRALLEPLGIGVPVYPVKGYSATLELEEPAAAPAGCVLDAGRRVIITRLGERILRVAGTAEFCGYDLRIETRRAESMLESALQVFPALRATARRQKPGFWAGLRPMTPDGPPLLGRARPRGLWLNTGHGAMGWTQAAGSAEVLADLITGKPPAIDLTGLDAARYRGIGG